MSNKSLYASNLKIRPYVEIDDDLERSRNITLQGRISYKDCLRDVEQVGNNIYAMSPLMEVGESASNAVFGNGLTLVNGHDAPYHFPNTMTLFQQSQDRYENSTVKDFVKWCETHSRKTVVSFKEVYG